MVNPFRTVWEYYERTGVRRDLPVLKRIFVEAPHMGFGMILGTVSAAATYIYLYKFYDTGIGYQSRFTVMRSDDIRIPKFRKEVLYPEAST